MIPIFTLDEKQYKKYLKWEKKIRKEMPDTAIGGYITFSFTPTGLGIITKVTSFSGKELDLTDIDSW